MANERVKLVIAVGAICCLIVYLIAPQLGVKDSSDATLHAAVSMSQPTNVQIQKPVILKPVGQGVEDSSNDPMILKTIRKEGISYNLGSYDTAKMSQSQRLSTVHSILDNTDTVCKRKLRMGEIGDGGWEVCDDVDVRPRRPCLVYSFGIAGDWTFDDDMALNYGCHVHSFDPSINVESHNRSDLVHFHKIGISGKTERRGKWNLYTFSDIRKMLGHQHTDIDIVKMDVENAEWGAIPNMVATGEMKKFKQFLAEFHCSSIGDHHLNVVKSIETEGYRKFYVHKNPACNIKIKGFPGSRSICYEVHYVRRPHEKLD